MIRNIQRKLKKSRGFTLVELMIVVAIVGILAALAIYGVRKYMANAKSAEARNSLGQLSKDAATAYDREHMAATILADKGETGVSNALCLSAAAKVPAAKTSIAAKKYQSAASEWEAGDSNTGWQCLKFSMSQPQYYMYGYTSATTDKFTATAEGDLDGDATTSLFSIDGQVRNNQVVVSPTIAETLPEE